MSLGLHYGEAEETGALRGRDREEGARTLKRIARQRAHNATKYPEIWGAHHRFLFPSGFGVSWARTNMRRTSFDDDVGIHKILRHPITEELKHHGDSQTLYSLRASLSVKQRIYPPHVLCFMLRARSASKVRPTSTVSPVL